MCIRDRDERGISVIYITHDLGVVAKVADFVNVMYAGRIVEAGTIDEIFYNPRHPYTWGLLSAMPDLDTEDDRLYTIPGSPPNLLHPVPGDAFAPRNAYALNIDERLDPPMFQISETHYAATWLLDERAPKVEMPPELKARIEPVSYTHLDVYKRQGYSRNTAATGFSAGTCGRICPPAPLPAAPARCWPAPAR